MIFDKADLNLAFWIRCLSVARFNLPSFWASCVRKYSFRVRRRYASDAAGRDPRAATFATKMINAIATFEKFILFIICLFDGERKRI